jgi:hypothetical protein
MTAPHIELLFWEGCPSYPEARQLVEEVLSELGIDAALELREVRTEAEAEAERFPGSPTIRVDGTDVDAAGAAERPALTCRIYRRPDGQASPVPTRDQIKEALT